MINKNNNLFQIFSQNENQIAKLYAIYSLSFPKQKRMWEDLSRAEIKHSLILKNLDDKYGNDNKLYSVIEGGYDILKYVGDFIDKNITKAQSERITQQDAIQTAMSLEQSMIEKKCFDIFSSDETEIINSFEKLNKETEAHFKLLKPHLDL